MVESVDEPPLRGLHSWAKNLLPTRQSHERDKSQAHLQSAVISNTRHDTSEKPTLPQHAGNAEAVPERTATPTPSSSHLPDTQQQDLQATDTQGAGTQHPAMTAGEDDSSVVKAPIHRRFIRDVKRIITASWINWLLIFVPVSILVGALREWGGMHSINPSIVFALCAVAIIPLASLLAYATESVAIKLGDSWGALLNVTFGNAVEIIVFVIALQAGEVRIVQAAAVGSILSNLLLVLGMALALGGLRYREQLYNSSMSQMSACLLSLSVVSLLLPTAFHAAFADDNLANRVVLKVSRGTSVVLLIVYVLYLLFQLKSHAYMYASTPQHVIDEESHPGVLARIMDSSSSSSSDSSSDDSDSTSGSVKTSNRIRRALRRRRRKSSSSTKDEGTGSFSRSETAATLVNSSRTVPDNGMYSGDEADGETNHRGRASNPSIQTRDFENEAVQSASHNTSKSALKTKKPKTRSKRDLINTGEQETAPDKSIPVIQVGSAEKSEERQKAASPRPPQHTRNLSNAIKPVLNSANFPHHEAMTRSLAPPELRARSRATGSSRPRRASSMPDIHGRTTSPFARAASPHCHVGMPVNADGEIVIVDTVEAHPHLSTTSAVVLLLATTGAVALCAEFLVGSIDYLVSSGGVSSAFIGLIILPIVGNAAEHVTAVTVAYKNKMDLSINIALGSSIQIALFVTPLMVLLGWALGQDMSLYFSLFEVVSLFASAFIVNFMMIDGRSNWLEGTLLIAAYVIIGISAFFIPSCGLSDTNGLVTSPRSC